MSRQAISKVLTAEAEAETIRREAHAEANARIEACRRECAARTEREIAATKAELTARLNTVRGRADELIAQSREEAGVDIAELRTYADEKMREAVKHIEWELCDV